LVARLKRHARRALRYGHAVERERCPQVARVVRDRAWSDLWDGPGWIWSGRALLGRHVDGSLVTGTEVGVTTERDQEKDQQRGQGKDGRVAAGAQPALSPLAGKPLGAELLISVQRAARVSRRPRAERAVYALCLPESVVGGYAGR
jgi:hypothetical protein